jgi:preprotein translocase subunit SecE
VARPSAKRASQRIVSPGSIRRGSPIQFFQDTISELGKAVWPSREETVRLTKIVIILSAIAGFIFAGFDFVLGQTFGKYIIR